MHFLLNDVLLNVTADDLADDQVVRRFGAISFDFVQLLGQELFAEYPLMHHTHPERATKLFALLMFKAPSINAALFLAPARNCKPREVSVRYASVDIAVMAGLAKRRAEGDLTPTLVDREVWRRLAA